MTEALRNGSRELRGGTHARKANPLSAEEKRIYLLTQSALRTHGLGDVTLREFIRYDRSSKPYDQTAYYTLTFYNTITPGIFDYVTETALKSLEVEENDTRMSRLRKQTQLPVLVDGLAVKMKGILAKHKITGSGSLYLHPTMLGGREGGPLKDYFQQNFPKGMHPTNGPLSNAGYARLIMNELGGNRHASIIYVDDKSRSHNYVVLEDTDPDEPAYNNTYYDQGVWPITNREVLATGKDVTGRILKAPWSVL